MSIDLEYIGADSLIMAERATKAAQMLEHGDRRVALAQIICGCVALQAAFFSIIGAMLIPPDGAWQLIAGLVVLVLSITAMGTVAAIVLLLSIRDNPTVEAWRLIAERKEAKS